MEEAVLKDHSYSMEADLSTHSHKLFGTTCLAGGFRYTTG